MTDIGAPPTIPAKQELMFQACLNNRHAECVGESATQICTCMHHKLNAEITDEETAETERLAAEERRLDAERERDRLEMPHTAQPLPTPESLEETEGVEVTEIFERNDETGKLEHTRTLVDGKEAVIHQHPDAPHPMPDPTIAELLHRLTSKDADIKSLEGEIDELKSSLKEMVKEREGIITAMKVTALSPQMRLL